MATTAYDPLKELYAGGKFKVSDAVRASVDYNTYGKANKQWTNYWEPQWKEYGEGLQRELQTAYDRSVADARGKLGYGLAMTGSGEGGLAEASRLSLEQEAQNKRMDISQRAGQVLQQAYLQFMTTKDAQAYEMAKMAANHQYQKEMAEMNEPSWWESLGQIAGMAAAFLI